MLMPRLELVIMQVGWRHTFGTHLFYGQGTAFDDVQYVLLFGTKRGSLVTLARLRECPNVRMSE